MAAEQGNTVRVHYTGTLDDGTVFDSSREREPIEFTIGEGQIIPGVEAGVMAMEVGEKKTITIPPDEAYGEVDPELVHEIDRSMFPENVEIEPGQMFQANQPDGQTVILNVLEVKDDAVKVDANHPLAGKPLTFELELQEIVS